jgi:ectoine hydroxylase-related dioxygenase (phytanoyl-CoA dioxygenase family)
MSRPAVTALDFVRDGVEIRGGLVSERDLRLVASEIAVECAVLAKAGIRNLEKKVASIARLVADPVLVGVALELLGGEARLVRALFFDKTPGRNWAVPWHQDKTVTLNSRVKMDGWGPWSEKDGVCHVQPPCQVLDRMLAIRLHLDPCDEENGCLRVIPGSHRSGILKPRDIERIVATSDAVPCIASAGDAVIMRPHVVHSSRKSVSQSHRRVIHLEYSDYELPSRVRWAA